MKDVARVAGVSLATVSKVMNGAGNVDIDLCQRVREAASTLGYRRNYIARLLKTSKTNHIHIILPNMSDQNFRSIYAGAEQVLNDHGYLVSLHLTSENRSRENSFLDTALQQMAAGVIIATCQPDDGTRVRELDESGVKLVFVEREPTYGEFSYLEYNNKHLIQSAVARLAADNFTKLVLLAGPREYSSELQAARGFRDALDQFAPGISGDILEADLDLESSFLAMATYLDRGARPDAIITTSMVTYTSAKKAIEILGLAFPKKVRFVTLGHLGWADRMPDDTEVISQNSYQMGEEAARALIADLEDPLANAGRYHCVETLEPASRREFETPPSTPAKPKGRLKLFLQQAVVQSIKPLLSDFTNRFGYEVDIDVFYYDDMFAVFDNPERLAQYDIIQLDQPVIAEMAVGGCLERLDGMLDRLPELPDIRGDRPTAALDIYSKHNGSVYAVPFRFGSQLMFYRTDLFDNPEIRLRYRRLTNGELRPPRTWKEFNIVARFFTRAFNPDSPVEYGVALGARHYIGAVSEFVPRLWAYGGSVLDGKGGIAIDSRQAVEALHNYIESLSYSSPDCLIDWQDGQIQRFTAGKAAMMTIFTAMAEHLVHRDESRVVGKVGYALLPGGSPVLGGWALGIRKGSPQIDAAVEWIRWITSDRMAVPHTVLGGANMAAMLRQNSEIRAIYPWLSMTMESFRISRPQEVSSVSTGGSIRYRDFAVVLSQHIHAAIRGELSPEQALEKTASLFRQGGESLQGIDNVPLPGDAELARHFTEEMVSFYRKS